MAHFPALTCTLSHSLLVYKHIHYVVKASILTYFITETYKGLMQFVISQEI